jgi:Na+/proline symporter
MKKLFHYDGLITLQYYFCNYQHIVSELKIVHTVSLFAGLLPIVTSQRLMGKTGDWLMFVFMLVAVVTTVSGEVLSASSIVIYDIYQTYVTPFM